MNQIVAPNSTFRLQNRKATVISNLICLCSSAFAGSFPLILWAHQQIWTLSRGDYPVSTRPLIVFYWFELLPKSGVLLAVLWLCALVGYANQKLPRRILEAVTSLMVGWFVAFGFFVKSVGENNFFEVR